MAVAEQPTLTPRVRKPIESTATGPMGQAVPPSRHGLRMSPLNRRRWQNFKANRRGHWSLWIFLVLFGLSLFAEFIANDRPLLVRYDGKFYFPVRRSAIRRRRSAAISRPPPTIAIRFCRS